MACSKYASTRQTTHAARMSRLLFGPCTDLLRDVLRQHIPETLFPATLQKRRVKGILLSLRNLHASQRELLYPQVGAFSGSYNDFDISLLYLLLRNITNITPHSNGWGSPPDNIDRSVSANIDRIRMIRNQIGAHCHRHDLSDADFFSFWNELKLSVVEIVRSRGISTNYEQIINDLANEPMDPDREDYWRERLQKQIKEDEEKYEEIVKNLDDIQEKIEGISSEQDKQTEIQRHQGTVQTKHGNILTKHKERLDKQGETQTKQGATLTEHQDQLNKQVEVQTKHGATLTEHKDRLDKQCETKNKQGVTLTEHEHRLNKHAEIHSKHEATLKVHEDHLTRHGEVQTKHGASLREHEDRLTRQGEVQAKHGGTLTELEDRLDKQGEVQTTLGSTLTQHEDLLTRQSEVQTKHAVTLKEHEKRLDKQEEVRDQEAEKMLETSIEMLLNHKSSRAYIRTGQVDSVKQRLLDQRIVLLTGKPGDGKSTAAKQVMCELAESEGYVPAILNDPSEWKKVVNSKQKMILHVDDMFGSTNLDTGAVDKWKKLFDLMQSSANKGKILILITSRTSIIAEVRKVCHESFLIEPEYECDLASNVLTSKEKEKMLLQYAKVKTYKATELIGDHFRKYEERHGHNAVYNLTDRERVRIVNSEPYYGFPQTCFFVFCPKGIFSVRCELFLTTE